MKKRDYPNVIGRGQLPKIRNCWVAFESITIGKVSTKLNV